MSDLHDIIKAGFVDEESRKIFIEIANRIEALEKDDELDMWRHCKGVPGYQIGEEPFGNNDGEKVKIDDIGAL